MKINHPVRCFCYHCKVPVKTNVSATESRCVKGQFNKRRTSKLQASPSFSERFERERKISNKDLNRTPKTMDTEKAHTKGRREHVALDNKSLCGQKKYLLENNQ